MYIFTLNIPDGQILVYIIISIIFYHITCFIILVSSELRMVTYCLSFEINSKMNTGFLLILT